MPDGLDTCLFTTSGTEANELAWRMATEVTGGDGAIVVEHAYHGSTSGWPTSARTVATGSPACRGRNVRGPDRSRGGAARTEARRDRRPRRQLDGRGHPPALVLADQGFTSEGILDPPAEFVAGLSGRAPGRRAVPGRRGAGRLRTGRAADVAFPRRVTPDFVTLGKPMGAGYPIGALVTRRAIADRLAGTTSTSRVRGHPRRRPPGRRPRRPRRGRPAHVGAGLVGDYLRGGLRELAGERGRLLGAVRGRGLIAGVDTRGPDGGVPTGGVPRALLDGLTRRGVLAGLTGPDGTVLKIRPPLVWENDHVDVLIDALGNVVAGT